MAFKIIQRNAKAISCDKKNPVITGFVTGVKTGIGKFKSRIYDFTGTDGKAMSVWGNAAIDGVLMSDDAKAVDSKIIGRLVRLTNKGDVKLKGGKSFHDIQVEIDFDKALPKKQMKNVPF